MTRPWQVIARELAQESKPSKIRELSIELGLATAEQQHQQTGAVHQPGKPQDEPPREPSV